jgi:hypothetical protein
MKERMIERGGNVRSILDSQNLFGRNTAQTHRGRSGFYSYARTRISMESSVPEAEVKESLRGSMVIQCRTCGEGKGCNFKIRWTTAGAPFSLDEHRLSLCCLSGPSAIPLRPCQTFDVFLVVTDRLDSILPASHPARELARYLVGQCPNLNLCSF